MPTPEELLNATYELDKNHDNHAAVAGTLRKYFEARAEEAPEMHKGDFLAHAKLSHLLASLFAAGGVGSVPGPVGPAGPQGKPGPAGPPGRDGKDFTPPAN